jgi:Ser/Thr protein kinase RdoA (MazF antagonist)
LLKEAKLAFDLSSLQLRVPRPVPNKEGKLVCIDEDFCLALYQFEEGEYFSGRGRQLDSAAESFSALTRAATDIVRDDSVSSPANDQRFLTELTCLLDGARALNHPRITPLIERHYENVINHLANVSAHNQSIQSLRLAIHLDYHPLNLLMRDDEVICILDFEHLKFYPVLAGVGFAGYKLSRQAMVHEDIRNQEAMKPTLLTRWLNGWQTSFGDLTFTPQQLGIGATYQELFLIHLILDAFLKKSDSRFLYDLEKHLIGLYEIEAIISRY